jgi:two-component system sensor histidine kinase DesK
VLTAAGIECEVSGSAAGLPVQVQSALGWVVREATTNVLRHGDAQRCAVSLRVTDDRVVLTVENDGVPAAEPCPETERGADPGPGSGLVGLRERLGKVDGVLRAGPVGGDGMYRLTADVPLPVTQSAVAEDAASAPAAPSPLPHPMNEVTS